MDWCDKVFIVFLSYFYVLMLANIISIEIYSWAFVKEVLVTSKPFIVTVFDFQFWWFELPYILAKIVIDCVLEVVVVWKILLRIIEDKFFYCLKSANERQLRSCRAEQNFTNLFVQLRQSLCLTNFINRQTCECKHFQWVWIQISHNCSDCIWRNIFEELKI